MTVTINVLFFKDISMKHRVFALLLFISFSLLGHVEEFNLLRTYSVHNNDNSLVDYEDPSLITEDEIVKYIRKYGTNERDNYGNTILHAAAMFGDVDVIETLLEEGVDIEARNIDGLTPLHLAMVVRNAENIEVFLRNGANINTQTEDGKVPLMTVSSFGAADFLEFFIAYGADVNLKDRNGFTALHYAAMINYHYDNIKLLVKNGADVNVCSCAGITPLHLAVFNNSSSVINDNSSVIKFLLENGADSGLTDEHGNKPVHYMHEQNLKLIADLSKHIKTRGVHKNGLDVSAIEFNFWLNKQFKGAAFHAIDSRFSEDDI
jgi:ankyrin repeat protein